ncbi:hypothetical protein AAT17_11615 [Nonlabens sp. MIC269]|uniref:hypothetical protein n=1 Tax=Nonlabens TaxID=363408 RepID=UPI000722F8D6|nr:MULTISPECIES: hypothetical protein [Nonlabens]ALM21836.1 hypothetical protein AAT17_11615 [Nonlabens sp. MIC269]ARN71430.1 hypothetical protein BST91_07145 [Nonlabens tegetincola]
MIQKTSSFIIGLLIVLITTSCSNKYKLNGKYSNEKNVHNDFISFDSKTNKYVRVNNDIISKGKYFQIESSIVLKSDSIGYYENLKIDYKIESTTEENVTINFNKDSFIQFQEKHSNIKLFFVGFSSNDIKKPNETLIYSLDSEKNTFKLAETLNYFRIIGLRYDCNKSKAIKECNEIMTTAFRSELYEVFQGFWGIELNIDLKSVTDMNLNNLRIIGVTDSIYSNTKFKLENKIYKKIEKN